ncbi:MAG: glycosyl transferase [Rickettsiales bacterium]|nr:glycosyl transferase [Rickettsiales bacterium]
MSKNLQIKISVVIPSFNREKYLERAIKSILNQSVKVDEIILVDNGSSDNTKLLIKNKYPFVKIYNEDRAGVSFARNTGINKAKNNWIAFLDSDDEWKRLKIEKQVKKIFTSKDRYKIIHTNEIWMRDGKHLNQKKRHEKKEGYLFRDSLNICKISPSSVLMHKSLFHDCGMFNGDLKVCEDYELWLRITSKVLVGLINEPLIIKYGGHDGQLSKKYWGIDRFRVKALENLILNYGLNSDQEYWATKTLIEKINILLCGAKKRKNYELIKRLNKKKIFWRKKNY